MAPRVRVRNQATLRAQFPGLSTEDTADALITGAARASATVGGAVGAWATLPVLPAFPVEIVTETLALIGIEIKLIAELHELYGMPATGNVVDRATAYVGSWAHRRGVLAVAPAGLIMVAGSPLARRLRRRLYGRVGPERVLARPAVHRGDGRRGAQQQGDPQARPGDPRRPAPRGPGQGPAAQQGTASRRRMGTTGRRRAGLVGAAGTDAPPQVPRPPAPPGTAHRPVTRRGTAHGTGLTSGSEPSWVRPAWPAPGQLS